MTSHKPRMTAAEYREYCKEQAAPSKNKYNAKRMESIYGPFDSRAEYKWYFGMVLKQDAGLISQLHRPGQLMFLAINGSVIQRYKPDACWCESGSIVYGDYKGYRTRDWKKIVKLWMANYPNIELREFGK